MGQQPELSEPAEVDAAKAFEDLRGEVALLHKAMAGFAAERAAVPDYSETLGEIVKGMRTSTGFVGKLASSPVFSITPAEFSRQMTAGEVRPEDQIAMREARQWLLLREGDFSARL